MRYFVAIALIAAPLTSNAQDRFIFDSATELMNKSAGSELIIIFAAMTALSIAPGIALMITCFPFIVTVLSIARQAIGLPQSPPSILIVGLSIFLTWFVLSPVFYSAWNVAMPPLRAGEISIEEAIMRGIDPFRHFMEARTDPEILTSLSDIIPDGTEIKVRLSVLIPSFMISEIQRSFEIGFLISLPFLIIDLVVSAVLMSMGMMMLSPSVVSLPFKLAFFVVVDGWGIIATALVRSYQ